MKREEAKTYLKDIFTNHPDILEAFRDDDWNEVEKKLDDEVGSDEHSFYSSIYNLDPTLLNEILMELKYVPEFMFFENEDIKSFEIPHNVESIHAFAFSFCVHLTNIVVPKEVTRIGCGAFNNCISLTRLVIPESVTGIGYDAFSNCTSLTSITIPDSVTHIGDDAFSNCTSLTSLVIPTSVTNIGKNVFQFCTNLNLRLPKRFKNRKNIYMDCKSVKFY